MTMEVTLSSATLGEDGRWEPPLGPLYIASTLEGCGVDVEFRDYQLCHDANPFAPDALVEHLSGHRRVLLISCFVDMLPVVIAATRRLVEARPDTLVVLGGPGPTAGATQLMEHFPWITGIVKGEGEATVVEWVHSMKRSGPRRAIAGMVMRDGDDVMDGGNRPRVLAIDDLRPPAYHLVDWEQYTHARVITTRGCPYRCSFCDVAALWGNKAAYRSLEKTIEEMLYLRTKHGRDAIAIVDDTFVLDRARVEDFCHRMIDVASGVEWGCFGRINLMTPKLIELMERAGCRAIFYGIDSGSPAILKRTIKSLKAESILPTVRESAQAFDKTEASFIWGYPFEELDDFKRTLELAGECSLLSPGVNVQMHMLSPLPNSPIYQEFGRELITPEPEDARWLLLPQVLFDERSGEVREMVQSHPQLFPGFFNLPTPAKAKKREFLEKAMEALDRTVGDTLLDPAVSLLVEEHRPEVERALLNAAAEPEDRIGVGLAVGFLRRCRRRNEHRNYPFEGNRGAAIVRERSRGRV